MASLARRTAAQMLSAPFGRVATGPRLAITLVDPVCQAIVTGVPDDESFRTSIAGALGFALPTEPNQVAGDLTRAIWIAPGQWLVTSDDPAGGTLTMRLGEALYVRGGGFVSCLRDGLAMFELSGPAAGEVLAMGCALDCEGPDMVPGRSARTLFAGVSTILYAHRSHQRWRLHVERSLARHMMEWLQKAAGAAG